MKEKRGTDCESEFYEREKDPAAGDLHVTSHGGLDGGQFHVQYCGQLFRGINQ